MLRAAGAVAPTPTHFSPPHAGLSSRGCPGAHEPEMATSGWTETRGVAADALQARRTAAAEAVDWGRERGTGGR